MGLENIKRVIWRLELRLKLRLELGLRLELRLRLELGLGLYLRLRVHNTQLGFLSYLRENAKLRTK